VIAASGSSAALDDGALPLWWRIVRFARAPHAARRVEGERTALARSVQDPSAFTDFYEANAKQLLIFFSRRILDAQVAMDLTAETFAQAYAARTRFRGDTHEVAQAWLYTIAHRQLATFFRRGYADRRLRDRLGIELPPPGDDELRRVDDLAGTEAIRVALRDALQELSPEQREALDLRVVQDLGYDEIAARLAISEDVVRARVSRGLRALRPLLAPLAGDIE
jgi:RNA polymerase sigma-70 factor (ECF subfamily)